MIDMKTEGFEKYCLHLDRLEIMAKEHKFITIKILSKIYNDCNDKNGNEQLNLQNAITRETCVFGRNLLSALGKTKLTVKDITHYQDNKEYLYRAFFKPEYEPIVQEIEK